MCELVVKKSKRSTGFDSAFMLLPVLMPMVLEKSSQKNETEASPLSGLPRYPASDIPVQAKTTLYNSTGYP